MTPLSVHYSKGLAITELVVGALLLIASLFAAQWLGVFAGGVLTLLGILMLVNPMLRVETHEVQLRSPLGFTSRRHPVSSPADLRFQGKSLHHVPSGKKIATLGFGMRADDVERLRAQVPGSGA